MCDYSLRHLSSRPANIDDRLISTRFKNSITGGFCAAARPDVAVCLLPGTELAFDRDVEVERLFKFLPYRIVDARVARFRRINEKYESMHHDALEFPDGSIVLLTSLREGQCATVLQLPATDSRTRSPATETRHAPAVA